MEKKKALHKVNKRKFFDTTRLGTRPLCRVEFETLGNSQFVHCQPITSQHLEAVGVEEEVQQSYNDPHFSSPIQPALEVQLVAQYDDILYESVISKQLRLRHFSSKARGCVELHDLQTSQTQCCHSGCRQTCTGRRCPRPGW